MNKLTRMMTDSYKPKMAIVVYESSKEDNSTYLERRDISDGKMGAGVPLSQKCLSDIFSAICSFSGNVDLGLHGVIPSNLLYSDCTPGHFKLVWYNAPQQRNVYFSESLGIPDGKMNVPGLVYCASESKLRMFAFKGKKPKGVLYKAPFMNVCEEYVCLGNAKIARPHQSTFANMITYWEEMFWRSQFSHILGENPVSANLSTLTKQLIETGAPFPMEMLVKAKVNLNDLLR